MPAADTEANELETLHNGRSGFVFYRLNVSATMAR
jgi:hypothetical protein